MYNVPETTQKLNREKDSHSVITTLSSSVQVDRVDRVNAHAKKNNKRSNE